MGKQEAREHLVKSETELPEVARKLLSAFPDQRVFAFYGEMGAGKTTFIKALCMQLGVEDSALSPTYAIVNEYHTQDDTPVYHFDFYRINKLEEIYDIGYEEYIHSGHYCLIEWPELMRELLPEEVVTVHISSDTIRTFSF